VGIVPYVLADGVLYFRPLKQRMRHSGARVYGEILWRSDVGLPSVHHFNPAGKFEELRPAWDAIREFEGIKAHPGGRPKTQHDDKIDKLAEAGVKWFEANRTAERYVTVEDFGRPEMGEATGRGTVGINKHMGRAPQVVNADVHRRMHELMAEEKSAR
jgi:hypothetical protein